MSLFNTTTGTDAATGTDAGFDVNAVFDGIVTVFGFFRQIIDFFKGIFTPLFEGLFNSFLDETDDAE